MTTPPIHFDTIVIGSGTGHVRDANVGGFTKVADALHQCGVV